MIYDEKNPKTQTLKIGYGCVGKLFKYNIQSFAEGKILREKIP